MNETPCPSWILVCSLSLQLDLTISFLMLFFNIFVLVSDKYFAYLRKPDLFVHLFLSHIAKI